MEAQSDNSHQNIFNDLSTHTGEGIVVDIGTGDGLFVYQSARQTPNKFFIGIDSSVKPLKKISEKIYRKSDKGGAKNALFIQAAVEDLPTELNGIADEVHVHFPWGSLLRAVAKGEVEILRHIRRICSVGCLLEIVIGLDPVRDATEINRLGLTELSSEFIETKLKTSYRAVGFEIEQHGFLRPGEWPEIKTSWAKRLRGSDRTVCFFIARAVD